MDSINLIGEEIGFQSDKNIVLVKLNKIDNEEMQIKHLSKELDSLLKDNSNLKQKYRNVIQNDKIVKFTIGSEMYVFLLLYITLYNYSSKNKNGILKTEKSMADMFSCLTRADENDENTAYLFKYDNVFSNKKK